MENVKNGHKRHIFIVSDATGQTAERVVDAALRQFKTTEVIKKVIPHVRLTKKIQEVIDEAAGVDGIVIFTLVSPSARQEITEMGRYQGVPTIDLLGPLLTRFSDLLEISPMAQPGLDRQLDDDYFKRIESIDFTIKHDDGLRMNTLDQAEIVLLGVSRTTKTPVSIYLSYRGWKVANIPVLHNQPLPREVASIDRGRMVALTVKPSRLQLIRMERQRHLQNVDLGDYTDPEQVKEEVTYALQLYRDLGCSVVDVTYKSIEETSTDVMRIVYAHTGMKKGKIY
ncbi:MAG: kinase/pyrophosphorylase [Candidatus Aminicenantes bacterium]|nr:kinase/pyrophosphorylase [Candidatus Aminicenantes bacterium]